MTQLIDTLRALFRPVLEGEAVDLIELQVKGDSRNPVIKVFVDVPGGITLKQCEDLTRQFLDILDMEDVVPGRYRLEVSSPGADRPLRTLDDFFRNIGKFVRLRIQEGDTVRSLEGKILKSADGVVEIQAKSGAVEIPVSKIKEGRIKLPW